MEQDDWTVQVFVPADDGPTALRADRGGRVVEASVEAMRAGWADTIQALTAIGDAADAGTSAWGVSEIEVGLTLSASGRLLFIAEAGAEASVRVKLTRRTPAAGGSGSGGAA